MTPRQRMIATLNHRRPDRVPIQLGCREEIMEGLRRHYGVETNGEVAEILDADLCRTVTAGSRFPRFAERLAQQPTMPGDGRQVVWDGLHDRHTRLLRLDQEPFYELMTTQAEVVRGIIRVLNRHLRARVQDMAQDFAYIQQMGRVISAAVALEAGRYDPRSLDEVGQRTDALGQLARVFQRMANEVQAREQRLKQEVHELRIQIDQVRKAREVAEITETEYFQQLQESASKMRARSKSEES